MSAERGWIGEPQRPKEWHQSIYSRRADKIRHRESIEEAKRGLERGALSRFARG